MYRRWPDALLCAGAGCCGYLVVSQPTGTLLLALAISTLLVVGWIALARLSLSPGRRALAFALAALLGGPPLLIYFVSDSVVGLSFRVLAAAVVAAAGLVMWENGSTPRRREGRTRTLRSRLRGLNAFLVTVPLVLAAQGSVVGALRGNGIYFLASDLFRMVLTAAVLVVVYRSPGTAAWRIAIAASSILIAFDLVPAFRYLQELGTGASPSRAGGGTVPGLALATAFAFSSRGRARRVGQAVLLFEIFVIVLSLTRGMWLAAIAVILITAAGSQQRHLRVVPYLIFFVLATVAIFTLAPPQLRENLIGRAQSGVSNTSSDDSFTIRLDEIDQSTEALGDRPVGSAIGAGFGAQFDENLGESHQIHNTFASVFFRHGASGLLLFVAWFFAAALVCRRRFRRSFSPMHLWALSTVLGTLLLSISVYSLIGEPLPLLALALLMKTPSREGSADSTGQRPPGARPAVRATFPTIRRSR